jgi:hypothetical protein
MGGEGGRAAGGGRQLGPLEEEDQGFRVTAVLERSEERIKVAWVEWKKEPFEAWLRRRKQGIGLEAAGETHKYRLPDAASGSCTDDTWAPTATRGSARRASPGPALVGVVRASAHHILALEHHDIKDVVDSGAAPGV